MSLRPKQYHSLVSSFRVYLCHYVRSRTTHGPVHSACHVCHYVRDSTTNRSVHSTFLYAITVPTHNKGHTLDVVITRDESSLVSQVTVTDPELCDNNGHSSTDHYAIHFQTMHAKPAAVQTTVSYRKLKAIDIDKFKRDITSQIDITGDTMDALVQAYNTGLTKLVDLHAPLREKAITLRPHAPWYTDELRGAKRKRRQCERKWRATGLVVHHQLYREQCRLVNTTAPNKAKLLSGQNSKLWSRCQSHV